MDPLPDNINWFGRASMPIPVDAREPLSWQTEILAVLPMIDIRPAEFPQHLSLVRALFQEYAERLDVDLAFQGFDDELESLPGKYAAPAGRVLLAWDGMQAVGCVALRPIERDTCEMKRLYVRPAARGGQLGRRLAERICTDARAVGYRRICLDTLPSMAAAVRLYAALGFRPIRPYVFNPLPGAMFLGRDLDVR